MKKLLSLLLVLCLALSLLPASALAADVIASGVGRDGPAPLVDGFDDGACRPLPLYDALRPLLLRLGLRLWRTG